MSREINKLYDKMDALQEEMGRCREIRDVEEYNQAYVDWEIVSFQIMVAEAKERKMEVMPNHLRALTYLEKAKELKVSYTDIRKALQTAVLVIGDWEAPPLEDFMTASRKLTEWKRKEHMIAVSKKWAKKNLDKVVERGGNYYRKVVSKIRFPKP